MINYTEAVILGIIQGLTEFIPISSTAHLRILPAFLGNRDPGTAYSAVIQLGTLISLLVYFRKDIIQFIGSAITGILEKDPFGNQDARMFYFIGLGTVPISIVGILMANIIKNEGRSLIVIAGSLILLALLLGFADLFCSRNREITSTTWSDILLIGLMQCLALIPGASRSGTTLTMGRFRGFSREASLRISFLLSIPSIGLAGIYELITEWALLSLSGLPGLILGCLVSGLVGYLTIAGLLRFLRGHSMLVFVIYRIALGIFILVLLHLNYIENI